VAAPLHGACVELYRDFSNERFQLGMFPSQAGLLVALLLDVEGLVSMG